MAVACWDIGDRAGFVMLWRGTIKCGDDFQPERREYEVEFNLRSDVEEGRGAYLLMMTRQVNFEHNGIYINDNEIGALTPSEGSGWNTDTICIPKGHIHKGKNTFRLTPRNVSGDNTGNVDDIWVRDPLLIYAVE